MKVLMIFLLCGVFLATPAAALEIEAPNVPAQGRAWMPEETGSLAGGLLELLEKALGAIHPDLREASKVSLAVVAAALLTAVLRSASGPVRQTAQMAGVVAVSAILLLNTGSMVTLAAETVQSVADYGKLLLPVMTAALAAQGGVTSSAALYAGTAAFNAVLTGILGSFLVPGIWVYLALRVSGCAVGEDLLRRLADLVKGLLSWVLKTLLMVFTTYLSLTGVVSGTTDAAALKAAKVTMSSFVPVVGGVLSDASEAVLVSAGLLKNAAGIYGILAVLALFLHPFLQIGIHYLILKLTAAVCAAFGGKEITDAIEGFGTAMGLLLAMTGAGCVMVLISTVCFLRGVG